MIPSPLLLAHTGSAPDWLPAFMIIMMVIVPLHVIDMFSGAMNAAGMIQLVLLGMLLAWRGHALIQNIGMPMRTLGSLGLTFLLYAAMTFATNWGLRLFFPP